MTAKSWLATVNSLILIAVLLAVPSSNMAITTGAALITKINRA